MYKRIAVVVGVVLSVALVPDTASAKPVESGASTFHFHLIHKNFCGAKGLTVSDVGIADVRYRITSRGRGQLPYYQDHSRETARVTDLASGKWLTARTVTNSKDLHIQDNGDGTWTIVTFGTGSFTLYDASGAPIARNPGQARVRILIDYGGTPYDFSDDEFVSFLGVIKESTGRTDDACAATLEQFGIGVARSGSR
ncbi:MAG: hypothetical protein QOI15_965 [Pseudonocardiales bacterium]|jgi:hypothetical protein|nr:hypothetical protein [Pseudonocardiales bacterium]MDT4920063.1 hypothetical protein [Pseudonocardiales bacterium]